MWSPVMLQSAGEKVDGSSGEYGTGTSVPAHASRLNFDVLAIDYWLQRRPAHNKVPTHMKLGLEI